MADAPVRLRRILLAQHGTIEGGHLHGWSYAFLRYVAKGPKVFLDLKCTQPHWPFPAIKVVRIGKGDIHRLVAAPGAKHLDARTLIAEAKELAAAGKK